MSKILLLILVTAFTGCTHHKATQPKTVKVKKVNSETLDVSTRLKNLGVKDVYTLSEDKAVSTIKKTLKEVEQRWVYALDSDKYTTEKDILDYHTTFHREMELMMKLEKEGKSWDEIKKAIIKKSTNPNIAVNLIIHNGRLKFRGDCNQFQSTLSPILVKNGINPQRIYRIFAMAYGDKSFSKGDGHAFLTYYTKSGRCYALEQLPVPRSCKYTITNQPTSWDDFEGWSFGESYYKYRSRSNLLWNYKDYKFFNKETLFKMENDLPIIIPTTNEGK
jgi:hypothetical protein